MNVLVACERSGIVREAFRKRGHNAWSCDLEPCDDGSKYHFQCDVMNFIDPNLKWDLMIAHPPCQYMAVSGLHWNKRRPDRAIQTELAIQFVRELMDAPIPRICIENPISCISSRIRKPDQIIQPYDFGENASKSTCLWLKNLPTLKRSHHVQGRHVEWPPNSGRMVERWANQCDSGQNKLGPSADRSAKRSVTYQGIADAMALQWSDL